jgi:hypothetical protein
VRKLRRCGEERMDFKDEDNLPGMPMVWPLYIEKNGTLWGFCPAKATWDSNAMSAYQLLKIAAVTGALPHAGGLLDQDAWFIDMLGWFIPRYDEIRFNMKAERVMGSPTAQKALRGG